MADFNDRFPISILPGLEALRSELVEDLSNRRHVVHGDLLNHQCINRRRRGFIRFSLGMFRLQTSYDIAWMTLNGHRTPGLAYLDVKTMAKLTCQSRTSMIDSSRRLRVL